MLTTTTPNDAERRRRRRSVVMQTIYSHRRIVRSHLKHATPIQKRGAIPRPGHTATAKHADAENMRTAIRERPA